MSVAKDLLIFVFLGIFIYCIYLRITLFYQKEAFIDTLKHNLKIPILAQSRAMSLMNIEEDELIREVYKSSEHTLDMINTIIDSYEYNEAAASEYLNLSQVVTSIFNSVSEIAKAKNVELYYGIDDDIGIYVNRDKFQKFLSYLILFLLDSSPQNAKAACFAQINDNSLTIKVVGYMGEQKKVKSYYNDNLLSVGHKIKMDYCKKFAHVNGWKFKEHRDKYNVRTFTIDIRVRKSGNISKSIIQPTS